MSGCTATIPSGLDCLNHADREWINSDGVEMRLCDEHDKEFYNLAIAAADVRHSPRTGAVATALFVEALTGWTA